MLSSKLGINRNNVAFLCKSFCFFEKKVDNRMNRATLHTEQPIPGEVRYRMWIPGMPEKGCFFTSAHGAVPAPAQWFDKKGSEDETDENNIFDCLLCGGCRVRKRRRCGVFFCRRPLECGRMASCPQSALAGNVPVDSKNGLHCQFRAGRPEARRHADGTGPHRGNLHQHALEKTGQRKRQSNGRLRL